MIVYFLQRKMSDKTFWNVELERVIQLKSKLLIIILIFPFNSISQGNFHIQGTLGITYNTSKKLALEGNIATGFKRPNIDDLVQSI